MELRHGNVQHNGKVCEPLRVLLADDQPEVRSALRLLLEEETDIVIAGEVTDIAGLRKCLQDECVDVVLLDWELPGMQDGDPVDNLRTACPHQHIVALSGRPEARRPAMDAGVDLFISKTEPPEQLLDALHGWRDGR